MTIKSNTWVGAFPHNFAPFGRVLNKAIFKCWGGGGKGKWWNFKLIDALLFWFSWYALASFHSDQHWTKTFQLQHSFAYSTNILGLTFSLVGHWLHLGWEGVASKIHSRTVSIVLQYNDLSASTTNHINSCIQ